MSHLGLSLRPFSVISITENKNVSANANERELHSDHGEQVEPNRISLVPFIKDVIQDKSINHHDKLGNHRNPILQSLLEQQQRRRLKKLWPADLIDG
jgi:hypothetical protein